MKKCKLCNKNYKWGQYADKRHIESEICPDCWDKPFEVGSICREDLPNDIDVSKVNNSLMNILAGKMSNGFYDCYEDGLEYALEFLRDEIKS